MLNSHAHILYGRSKKQFDQIANSFQNDIFVKQTKPQNESVAIVAGQLREVIVRSTPLVKVSKKA